MGGIGIGVTCGSEMERMRKGRHRCLDRMRDLARGQWLVLNLFDEKDAILAHCVGRDGLKFYA